MRNYLLLTFRLLQGWLGTQPTSASGPSSMAGPSGGVFEPSEGHPGTIQEQYPSRTNEEIQRVGALTYMYLLHMIYYMYVSTRITSLFVGGWPIRGYGWIGGVTDRPACTAQASNLVTLPSLRWAKVLPLDLHFRPGAVFSPLACTCFVIT